MRRRYGQHQSLLLLTNAHHRRQPRQHTFVDTLTLAQHELEEKLKAGKKPVGSHLSAYFVTATDPEHRYMGYGIRIASKAELVETKHVVKVTVGFTQEVQKDFLSRNQAFRPGSEVRARIDCGKARLAYVLLRDVIHVFYETVLFRWPFLR